MLTNKRLQSYLHDMSHELFYSELYQNMIEKGTDLLIERFRGYVKECRHIADNLRGVIRTRRCVADKGAIASKNIVGVDAGHNGVHFRFAYVPIYNAVAVLFEGMELKGEPLCVSGPPDIWAVDDEPERRENLLHMALEYYVARRAVELWNPDYLIIDGGIVLNPRLHPNSSDPSEYRYDFTYTVMQALELLRVCKENNILVLGFVKRSCMNYYGRLLGYEKFRDATFLSLIMSEGEYTEPFPMKNKVSESYARIAEELGMDVDVAEVYSSYVKTWIIPFRIEIPSFNLDMLDEAISFVASSANVMGIPYPIHEADRYTRISKPFSNIHTLNFFAKAVELVKRGELTSEELNFLLLQHGEFWALTDASKGSREP
jgi:hypothetical protein